MSAPAERRRLTFGAPVALSDRSPDWLIRTSTLDLVPLDRPVLVSFGDHDVWVEALGDAEVATVQIGVDTPALDSWRRLCGLDHTGALLVRPDHHVAWRGRRIEHSNELGHALDVVAGRG